MDFMQLWPRPGFNVYIGKYMCLSLNGTQSASKRTSNMLKFSVHVNILIVPLQPSRISYFFLTRSIRCLLQMLRLYSLTAFVGSSVCKTSSEWLLFQWEVSSRRLFSAYFQAAKTDSQQMFSLKRKGHRSKMHKSPIMMPNQKGFVSLGQSKKHMHWLYTAFVLRKHTDLR